MTLLSVPIILSPSHPPAPSSPPTYPGSPTDSDLEGSLMAKNHAPLWNGEELTNRRMFFVAQHPQRVLTDSMQCRPGGINGYVP